MLEGFDPTHTAPLYWQLYTHLRAAILSGRLKTGMRLPSTRALADELKVSRNTVLNAYEQLLAEGYLESVEATGTFVASVLPEQRVPVSPARPAKLEPDAPRPSLSRVSEAVLTVPALSPALPAHPYNQRAFSAGAPAYDAFPYELWARLVARQARDATGTALMYQEAAGYRPLRQAIADHATVTRRVKCTADQIVIVSGSQGGFDLAARVLLNPGDPVWVEDPGYPGARGALLAAGAQLIPIPIDQEGLIVEAGIERYPNARLVYITPSHQFPVGLAMSLTRRLALLEWAKRAGAFILEDDYDSEYSFAVRPLPALQGLDNASCVIYVGTFSKVLFPALRLGYLIVPPALVEAFLAVRRYMDNHPPLLEQAVLATFITEGHFGRHLRRMRTLYAARRAALLAAMQALPIEIYASETGMHCIGWLPPGMDDEAVTRRAAAHQVEVVPLSRFSTQPMERGGLLLGYAGIEQQEIINGAARLALAIRETGTIN